jgi:hypothetical protein
MSEQPMGEVELVARALCRAAGVGEDALITRYHPMTADLIGFYMAQTMPPRPAWTYFEYHATCVLQALGSRDA